jgi:1-deoxy-D-xylulose-5-phosphate reductoisomerase
VSGVGTRRDVVVLGSTGSIGTQALDVVRDHPDRFRVVGLAAGGGRPELLAAQAREFGVSRVVCAREPSGGLPPGWQTGEDAVGALAGFGADVVLNALTGAAGLPATLATLAAGSTLALANKESLVMGGELVLAAAQPGQLVPVDSEHSAIAQCLRGGSPAEVDRLVLTASGGPFRGWSADRLAGVTVAQALAHPTWDMGPVVTLNSSTLVNKGLELIEAHLLFGIPYDRIDVVVHPQSVVHSMVTFADGATIAQASPPDMHLPIALGLAWPDRLGGVADACDWSRASSWTFEPLDNEVFPAVRLARAAGTAGGTAPAVYNAANEVALTAFVAGELTYLGIVETVGAVLDAHITVSGPTLEQVRAADAWAREAAARLIGSTDSGAVMSAGTDA